MSTVAECYFLDVGQGSSQVVHFKDDSAIVIDTGSSYSVLGDLLTRQLSVRRITALILSHNDADHVGGVPGLVSQFRRAIDQIFILQDRPIGARRSPSRGTMQRLSYLSLLRSEVAAGNLPQPRPLLRIAEPCWLYQPSDPDRSVGLQLLYPSFLQNLDSQAGRDANANCGILLLQCGNKRVLFPGDASNEAWRAILAERDGRPIECDIIAVPHHGGGISETEEASDAAGWLYSSAIRCQTAIVSVGTSNAYGHPTEKHLDALRDSGACITCTQITPRCSDNLERLRPGVLSPQRLPVQSQPRTTRTGSGNSSDLTCAGTIRLQISPEQIIVERQDEHRRAIDSKLTTSDDHPLCRVRDE